jgi:hypothetical protein
MGRDATFTPLDLRGKVDKEAVGGIEALCGLMSRPEGFVT